MSLPVDNVKKALVELQELGMNILSAWQTGRGLAAAKEILQSFEKAEGVVVELMKQWPVFSELEDGEMKELGSAYHDFMTALLKKIEPPNS